MRGNRKIDRNVYTARAVYALVTVIALCIGMPVDTGAESLIEQAAMQGRTVARDSAQVYYIRAATYAQEGRYGPAIEAMYRAIEYLPNEPQLKVDLAILQAASGNENRAIEILEELTQTASPYPPAVMELGELYLAIGETERATASYRSLTVGNQPFAPAFVRLGDMRNSTGNREQAVRLYRNAIEADSVYIEAWMRLGSIQVIMDRYTQAMRTFDAALEIAPGNPGVLQFKTMAAGKKLEYDEGVAQGKMRARIIVVESREQCAEVRQRLLDGADFISLAIEVSTHPSADIGGDLGFFASGDLIPIIEDATTALHQDEFSPVIRVGAGFAVIMRIN